MMAKRRFEIVETPLPESRILNKFKVGNEDDEGVPSEKKAEKGGQKPSQADVSQPATHDSKSLAAHQVPNDSADTAGTDDSKADLLKVSQGEQESAAKPESTDNVQASETFSVNFKVGVPASSSSEYHELKKRSGVTEDFLMKRLISVSFKIMGTMDVANIVIPAGVPASLEPIQRKKHYARKSQIARFREVHDPLEIYSIADCCRLMYVAAFKEAVAELSSKLNRAAN